MWTDSITFTSLALSSYTSSIRLSAVSKAGSVRVFFWFSTHLHGMPEKIEDSLLPWARGGKTRVYQHYGVDKDTPMLHPID